MKKIYLLLISAIISAGAFAQAVVIQANPGTSGNIVVGQSNYHVSESIYLDAEVGHNNYTTAGSAIQQVFYLLNTEGINTSIANFNIYMKNVPAATTTLATGAYSVLGYTLVFSGTYTATPAGFTPITLTTPFVHTAGSNIEVLIVRTDNVLHTGNIYQASVGNSTDATGTLLTSRRYNGTTAPVSGTTSLTATNFRPAIAFNHTFPIDAIANDILFPTTSCFSSPQSVDVEVLNGGTTDIAAGAVTVTLHIRGANTYTGTLTNTGVITSGNSEFVTFTGISFNNIGDNLDTAYVHIAGDGTTYNDTLTTVNDAATTLSSFPLVEDVETTLPVFPYVETIALGQLWTIQVGDYTNTDQTTPLVARPPGTNSFLFDSYSGADSHGFESRLFSNCINLSTATAGLLTFWMSHDNLFGTNLDSMYVSVSTDKGVTWTRIQGYQRYDVTATTPLWRMESLNLAAYLGQTIQIGFEGVSQYGNAFSLDDITISATLPVSVLNFDAQRNGKVNDLTWRTAQEVNSSKFVIERSTDGGQTYTSIGQVAAAGNSLTERSYSFTDVSPIKGYNYYRLRIVDLDNKYKFSIIKEVRNEGTADFSFAPDPVQQQMKIKLDADKADKGFISITDMSGKQVYSSNITVAAGRNDLSVETGTFAPGLYIIKIQLSDDRIVQKFSKF